MDDPLGSVSWRRRTVKLRVDRDFAEKIAAAFKTSADPQALSEVFRAHLDCERERQRLTHAIEMAAREVIARERKYRSLEERYESLLRDNAAFVAERRRLDENLRDLRRQIHQERERSGVGRTRGSEHRESA